MGRPKLSDLSCSACQITFKRKSLLVEHMEDHSSCKNKRSPRVKSNWCHACRKNFEDNEYKLHIASEHKLDFPIASKRGIFSYDSGYVLSKKKIKQERVSPPPQKTARTNYSFDVSAIKIEPAEIPDYEEFISPMTLQKNALKVEMPTKVMVECHICGLQCKTERGLKIHMSAHRRIRKISIESQSSEDETKKDDVISEQETKATKMSLDGDPNKIPLNGFYVVQNTQPGFVLNMSPFQNQPLNNNLKFTMSPTNTFSFVSISNSVANNKKSVLNAGNTLNAPISLDDPNQCIELQLPKGVPKFDCNSEEYMKWLKKFVYKCKMSKYPLDPILCKKINYVTSEIICALNNPTGSMKKKSTHFYFMRMNGILLDVMLGQMRYALYGVQR